MSVCRARLVDREDSVSRSHCVTIYLWFAGSGLLVVVYWLYDFVVSWFRSSLVHKIYIEKRNEAKQT